MSAPVNPPIKYKGVNAEAICDCGATQWRVGIEVLGTDVSTAENHIRCIQCIACGAQLPIPFQQGG